MLTVCQWPFQPEDRSQAGHWEGDLIVGKDQGSAIDTLVERQTRMVRLLHMAYRDSDTLHNALSARMADCRRCCCGRSPGTREPRWPAISHSPHTAAASGSSRSFALQPVVNVRHPAKR